MNNMPSRRAFLGSASAALALSASPLFEESAKAQAAPVSTGPFLSLPADQVAAMVGAAHKKPGNTEMIDGKGTPLAMTMTYEEAKAPTEFEYHQHRDHIFQILDGETTIHVGGTPKSPRETRAGEYLCPDSVGSKAVTMKKGDYLFIPRMTPHKRVTKGNVTLILIASTS